MLHASSFWQVLANKAIGIFVSAPFPGMIRGGEETLDRGLSLYFLVAMELSTVVKGDGDELALVLLDGLDAGLSDLEGGSGGYLLNDDEASSPFDERNNAVMAVAANDGIAFPVADFMARFHGLGALRDMALTA